MAKKSMGLLALLTAAAAGAAAVFFSEKSNRDKAKKNLRQAASVAKKVEKDGKVLARKVITAAQKIKRSAKASRSKK